MSTTTPRASRLAAGLLAGGLALLPLTACSFSSDNLSCSGSECSVTLSGDGAQVDVLGTSLAFGGVQDGDRKSTRLNSSHANISYAVFCLKKKTASPVYS